LPTSQIGRETNEKLMKTREPESLTKRGGGAEQRAPFFLWKRENQVKYNKHQKKKTEEGIQERIGQEKNRLPNKKLGNL